MIFVIKIYGFYSNNMKFGSRHPNLWSIISFVKVLSVTKTLACVYVEFEKYLKALRNKNVTFNVLENDFLSSLVI